jgi:aldose 1-epimerase
MTAIDCFGSTATGETVHRLRIAGDGLTAQVLTWGALVQDLRLDGHAPPLVLGFETFADYPAHSPYFGAIAGRCANRIGDGRFTLDGQTHQLDRNFLGRHSLHGGAAGFGKRVWSVIDHGADVVTLELVSADGDMGYPGRLTARCSYRLTGGALAVTLTARAEAPTLCNLAQHSYFNLDDGGAGTILGHGLQIAADSYLPVDDEMIPTGEIRPVAGTDFDFRKPRPIGREENGAQILYDHNFCLSTGRVALRKVASVTAARSGLRLDIATTEPGVQFYAGHKLNPGVAGLDGIRYAPWSGLCMEPQVWPDAPNHPGFPSAELRPGETYLQQTEYRFVRD